jgi:hypothetical protein
VPQAGEQDVVVTGRTNAGSLIVDNTYVNQVATANVVALTDQAVAPATPTGGSVLYSVSGVPTFKDSSGNVVPLKNADPAATDSALVAWSFDPTSATQTFLTTAGVLYLSRVVLSNQQTLTNGLIGLTTAGGTLTSAQNYVALYNSAGTRIAVSADQSTAFATAGLITAAWTTPVASAAPGVYYVGVLCNGGTAVTLASGSTLKPNNVSLGNAGLTTATSRYLTSGTGQTVTPASVTLSSASGNVAAAIWAALS